MTARSGCGRSCGIRPSTGRQTSTAATPLRMPPPAPASGRKGTHPAAEEETAGAAAGGRRSCCRCHRAKAFCYQGKRYHFCRAAATERCGAWTAAGAPERRAKGCQGQGKKILISAHRQRHRSQWQRNRNGRDREYSWRNAGAKLPDGRQSKSEPYRAAESRRHKPYIQTGTAAPCRTGMRSEQIPHIKERAETSLPKPARKKHLPMERDIVSVSPRSKKIADTARKLWSPHRSRRLCCKSSARTAREAAVQTARYQQAAKAAQATVQKASQAAGRRCGPSCPPPEALRRR